MEIAFFYKKYVANEHFLFRNKQIGSEYSTSEYKTDEL